jgi:multidrug efflux pump subunit AcrA (membrane-fusion protein)
MEHAVHATSAGTVVEVDVSEGDQVETGRVLAVVEPEAIGPEGDGAAPVDRRQDPP